MNPTPYVPLRPAPRARVFLRTLLFAALGGCLSVAAAALETAAPGGLHIEVRGAPPDDAALRMAVDELRMALDAAGGRGRVLLRGRDRLTADGQEFAIQPSGDGLEVSSPGIGLVHGTLRLAETVRLNGWDERVRLKGAPAFRDRMFSYQGVRLNLPDESYYGRNKPFVNRERLGVECEAVREAMRVAVRYGFNQFTLLFFETFAPYRELVFRSHGKQAPDEETRRLAREILELLPRWKLFPDEARDWLVLDGALATDLWGGAPESVRALAETWSREGGAAAPAVPAGSHLNP